MTMRTFGAAFALLACMVLAPAARAQDGGDAKVIQDFMASWSSNDIDKVMSYVGDDVRYENIPPLGPEGVMVGKDKMRAFLADFFAKDPLIVPMTFRTEIKRVIADGKGGVAVERVDHQTIASKDFPLAVAAFFTVKDGKIVSWTDYFDGQGFQPVGTLMTALKRPK